ncbi:MAG: metallophosphoesterase [Bdellovibrionales bacterium]|jgi:serine/threonine protein phosphatase 1
MNKTRPSTPAATRLYAVGDIHGRLDLLDRLLAMIEADATNHADKKGKLIFLGDYVDRGLDSRGVIERLTGGFAAGLAPIFLRGNHDNMLLDMIKGDLSVAPVWLQLGGTATAASYGLSVFGGVKENKMDVLHKSLVEKVPPAHRAFLEDTLFAVTYGDYYFVHAGVRAGISLEKQKPQDQMWVRGDFLASTADFGKVVVHGHTISPEPDIRANRVGIDTGAYASGHLTCLILDGTERTFLQT